MQPSELFEVDSSHPRWGRRLIVLARLRMLRRMPRVARRRMLIARRSA